MTKSHRYGFKRRSYNIYMFGRNFFTTQWAGGAVLLFFVVVAMLLANLPQTARIYHDVLSAPVGILVGNFRFEFELEKFVNDGLMMIFFFTVGLEIKREVMSGHLSSVRKAILPVAGAVGGMIAPAVIYALINHGTEFAGGWGVPMATDIAFAIAIMSVVGKHVPVSLKVFLTALAVADDLGAIIVIALFYGSSINFALLGIAAVLLAAAWLLNYMRVTSFLPYVLLSVGLWFMFYFSGVHATIAGVLLAMFIPSTPKYNKRYFLFKIRRYLDDMVRYNEAGQPETERQVGDLQRIGTIAGNSVSLAHRFEHMLAPWVNYGIMPLFALVNAGVSLGELGGMDLFGSGVGMGIILGLWIGKPLGITLMSWIFVKLKLAVMPEGASWPMLIAVACLGGIGFTMSIFIDTLAFAGSHEIIAAGKIAILVASGLAAVTGLAAIHFVGRRHAGLAGALDKK